MLRHMLPYRIYYGLFESYGEYKLLKFQYDQISKNCRHIAGMMLAGNFARQLEESSLDNALNRHELSVFSQNGEDGILMYIFARIGTTNKTFVEFGVEDGRECNSANLAIHHGWNGLLMDGGERNVKDGVQYYNEMLGRRANDVSFIQAFITTENINGLISREGIRGEIDLLSIDIDGNDYWVWKAINVINPRVVVIEYNASYGSERKLTIPYQADFVWNSTSYPDLFYTGASLACLNALAEEKGYKLVGCDSNGVNAFFVRADLLEGSMKPVSVQSAFFPHAIRSLRFGLEAQRRAVERFDLLEIS